MLNDNATNQRILGKFVENNVIMCVSSLVEDLVEHGLLNYEDISNYDFYACPDCGGKMNERVTVKRTMYICEDCDKSQKEEPDMESQEVFEWWFVNEWFFEKLQDKGEVVLDSNYGYLWGRTTTGQAILLDGVVEHIASDLEILTGQAHDWGTV